MASLLRRAMVYLGLVDDDYDEYDEYPDPASGGAPARPRPTGLEAEPQQGVIRTLPRDPALRDEPSGITVTQAAPRSQSVRPITTVQAARVHVVAVTIFDDAREISDKFKDGQPVIVNLQGVDRDLRRRFLDFCSGLTYGLNGKMKPVAGNDVVLLTPPNVEVSEEEKRRLQERGLYRS